MSFYYYLDFLFIIYSTCTEYVSHFVVIFILSNLLALNNLSFEKNVRTVTFSFSVFGMKTMNMVHFGVL